jgi:16S rRNA (cytidine1402-2'-O)-methyltransferase
MKKQDSFKNTENTLYIIPTPIGNLSDISERIKEILLDEIEILLCEDTRHTQKLLNHLGVKVKTRSYHDFSSDKELENIILLLESGINIGMVSDAGMPGISDPGYKLINEIKKIDTNIVVIPGPTAFVLPLVWSGFPTNNFVFQGFLGKNKKKELEDIMLSPMTSIVYESPHKLIKFLEILKEIDSQRKIVVARELTKKNESYVDGTTSELLDYFQENKPRGEFVVVIKGKEDNALFELSIPEQFNSLLEMNYSKKDAMKEIAAMRNMKKSDVYKLILEEKDE